MFEFHCVNNLNIIFKIYLCGPFALFGETPRLRPNIGERFGDRFALLPFSFSGDGDDPPPEAELRREPVRRTVVSK